MSKLGAICDKLRLVAPSSPPPSSPLPSSSPRRPASPVYTPSANKRKNFRPVNLNERNYSYELLENPPGNIASFPTSCKTTSVIVRNLEQGDVNNRFNGGLGFGRDRDGSTSESVSPAESTADLETRRYVFRGPPSHAQRQRQLQRDLFNASVAANSSSFYQTQVFPFMDYSSFPRNLYGQKVKRE